LQPAPADVRLRLAVAADESFLRELYAGVRAAELAATGWTDADKLHFCNMQFDAQAHHYRTYFPSVKFQIVERISAAADGSPIAVAIGRLYVAVLTESPETVLMDIALVPAVRGQGIGTRLVQQVLDQAQAVGHRVSLHVEADNPARRMYERFGFVKIDSTPSYDEMVWQPAQAATPA
jgi:ribosomal protein S18 acetylase RimI-like enzyme